MTVLKRAKEAAARTWDRFSKARLAAQKRRQKTKDFKAAPFHEKIRMIEAEPLAITSLRNRVVLELRALEPAVERGEMSQRAALRLAERRAWKQAMETAKAREKAEVAAAKAARKAGKKV